MLDGSARYNTCHVQDTVGLFTREGVDQVDNLVEMQCMWFAQGEGESFRRCAVEFRWVLWLQSTKLLSSGRRSLAGRAR